MAQGVLQLNSQYLGLGLWKLLSQIIWCLLTSLVPPSSPLRASYTFSCYGVPLIFVPGSCPTCPSLEFASPWKCSSIPGNFLRDGLSLPKFGPGCNARWKCEGLGDTFSHRPPQHSAVMLWASSRVAFQWKFITAGIRIFYRYHTKSLGHVWDFQFHLRYPVIKQFPVQDAGCDRSFFWLKAGMILIISKPALPSQMMDLF